MFPNLQKILQIPELKQKIIFTLLMLVVCRIGGFVPVPGINGELAMSLFKQATGGAQNLFQLVDIFSGGAFSQCYYRRGFIRLFCRFNLLVSKNIWF